MRVCRFLIGPFGVIVLATTSLVGLPAVAADFGTCTIKTTAPKEVTEALDAVLSSAVGNAIKRVSTQPPAEAAAL